ncbi:hypothetical protein HUT16_28825 [Kitasatospora sp. NA04385]|uniref:hypothetical protein n=1 Tax=Kitasatospora sp. NA04385 TaxID=2742135 RepID=UPI0015905797|nr:hypothetical protein [Kitasatospora sp. NA04385]QKW22554.1 hypothetical protein HUT16_28825 [Kitasatospora sp. NA04385]
MDLPLTGLLCLAVASGAARRPGAAGLALAAVGALKWTAWPAVPVVVALLAATAGRRAALRGAAVAVGGTALLVAPWLLVAPGPVLRQVFAFPLGRGRWPTPAASPLPGRLLAELGPAGWAAAAGLLLLGGAAVALSLLLRPPRHAVAAADRLAAGLTLAFLLAPAGRFGYLALPLFLSTFARLTTRHPSDRAAPPPHLRPLYAPPPCGRVPAPVTACAARRTVLRVGQSLRFDQAQPPPLHRPRHQQHPRPSRSPRHREPHRPSPHRDIHPPAPVRSPPRPDPITGGVEGS